VLINGDSPGGEKGYKPGGRDKGGGVGRNPDYYLKKEVIKKTEKERGYKQTHNQRGGWG